MPGRRGARFCAGEWGNDICARAVPKYVQVRGGGAGSACPGRERADEILREGKAMNTVLLKDGKLSARVLAPESSRYNRTRFNHSAFISDVFYDGTRFTQYERNQNSGFQSTDGCGLCCGYDGAGLVGDTPVGEWYLKPGVGLIRRGERELGIGDRAEYLPLDTRMEAEGRRAFFETQTPEVNGYAYRETRTVTLAGDELLLETTLVNTGEKDIVQEEYCHNFLSLGDREIGPGYRLDTPAIPEPARLNDFPTAHRLVGDATGFGFSGEILKAFFVRTDDVTAAPVAWRMSHSDAAAFVEERDSFAPSRIAIWGDYYVLSCEVFIPIALKAGESITWTRKWRFGV